MSFQWQLDGTNLPNATNASLVLTNVQLAQGALHGLTCLLVWVMARRLCRSLLYSVDLPTFGLPAITTTGRFS